MSLFSNPNLITGSEMENVAYVQEIDKKNNKLCSLFILPYEKKYFSNVDHRP